MAIRKAKSEDKEQLANLLIKFDNLSQTLLSEKQRQFRARKDSEKAVMEAAEKFVSNSDWIVFVVEDNGSLKGFIAGKVNEKKYRVYNKEGYVDAWFIETEYQNKGIGKELFDVLIKAFEEARCTHIVLDTNIENSHAIQIYEHMGFTKRLVTFFKPLQELP